METFKLDEGIILTEDFEEIEKHNGKKIKYLSLWNWLLKPD